ncbi:MAG: OmpA family protein, partial [Prevotella sp.]|nr:OmpA family protein [Prevotella sp.]
MKLQGGGGVDVGEAEFSKLLSPSLQLGRGYQFTEYVGLRGTVSGLWARNRYAYPSAEYKWNFIQ